MRNSARYCRASKARTRSSLAGRDASQVGDDRAQVRVGHRRVPVEAHRRTHLRAVLAHALGDGALDLVVAPRTDADLLVRRDVARHGDAKGSLELLAAGAERVLEVAMAVDHRRVAFHAVADGGGV